MSKYFIGISISELQHWFADNELPLLTDRVTYYKNCPDDSIPSDFDPGSIFNSLPFPVKAEARFRVKTKLQ